ncbi:MAG: hypothetical protein ABR915_17175 [Thermoguttaceae bacterium]
MTAKKTIAKTSEKARTAREKTPASFRKVMAAADAIIPSDCRSGSDRRNSSNDRREKNIAVVIERRHGERRVKVNRRRQIDPTTCERDYSPEEIEFMNAMDDYKRRSGRMFPTCSEILEVVRGLGYERVSVTARATPFGESPNMSVSTEQAV